MNSFQRCRHSPRASLYMELSHWVLSRINRNKSIPGHILAKAIREETQISYKGYRLLVGSNRRLRTTESCLPSAEGTELSAWDSILSFKSQGETEGTGGQKSWESGSPRPRTQNTLTEAGKSTQEEKSEMQETVFAREGKIRWGPPQPSTAQPQKLPLAVGGGAPLPWGSSGRAVFLPVLQGQLLISQEPDSINNFLYPICHSFKPNFWLFKVRIVRGTYLEIIYNKKQQFPPPSAASPEPPSDLWAVMSGIYLPIFKQYAVPVDLWKIHHFLAKAIGHLPRNNPSLIWGKDRLDKLSQGPNVLVFGIWSHQTRPMPFPRDNVYQLQGEIFCNTFMFYSVP